MLQANIFKEEKIHFRRTNWNEVMLVKGTPQLLQGESHPNFQSKN
jgi:hypothetical protein